MSDKHKLIVDRVRDNPASIEYNVTVPEQYRDRHISDREMLTRCDNRGDALDLRKDMGQVCHFGGCVNWVTETEANVTVWID